MLNAFADSASAMCNMDSKNLSNSVEVPNVSALAIVFEVVYSQSEYKCELCI